MKKFLLTLGCLALLALPALAAEKTFSKLSVDVPDGWIANEEDDVVIVLAPGGAAALSILLDTTDGLSTELLAKMVSQQLKGTEPKLEEGFYTFTFTDEGVKSTSRLKEQKGNYVMFTVTDPSGQYGPAISKIISSVKEKK